MNRKSFVLLVAGAIVIGYFAFANDNSGLFKGMLTTESPDEQQSSPFGEVEFLPPDLVAEIKVQTPENTTDNLTVDAVIKNMGEGDLRGVLPFEYEILIDDKVVFSNTDSYTTMAPGDEFNFSYPIPKDIYNYGSSGEITFTVDSKNSIKESNEDNNNMKIKYSY